MKKTILAIAITGLFAAGVAQAATVYDADGVKLNINGDLKVNYGSDVRTMSPLTVNKQEKNLQHSGVVDSNYIDMDDADISFDLAYDMGNGYTLGATMEISGENTELSLSDTFMSLSGEFGTVSVGKQPLIFDDAGISNDYKFGFDTYGNTLDSGNQVIKYKGDWDTFYGGIAYSLNGDGDSLVDNGDGTAGEDGQHQLDMNIGVRFADVDLAAFYSTGKTDMNRFNHVRNSAYIVQAKYNIDAFQLGAFYSNETIDSSDGDSMSDLTHYGLSGIYSMNAWNFGLGWGTVQNNLDYKGVADIAGVDQERNDYYANVAYAFTSNIQSYVEVGYSDEDNSEIGYIVGMEVLF